MGRWLGRTIDMTCVFGGERTPSNYGKYEERDDFAHVNEASPWCGSVMIEADGIPLEDAGMKSMNGREVRL